MSGADPAGAGQRGKGAPGAGPERPQARTPDGEPDPHAGPEVERLYQPKLDRVVLGRLLRYARPYRARLALSVLLLLAVAAGELLFPLLTRRGIDDHIRTGDLPGLAHLSLFYLGLLLVVFVLRYVQTVLMQATGQRITTDLRASLFSHLQTLDQGYFEKQPVGRIMTRLTGDVETLNELFTSGLVSIFGDLITLFGIAGILFWLDPRLAVIALLVVPPLLVVTLIFRAKVRAAYALIRVRIAALNAFLQETLAGIALVQLFQRERVQNRKFEALNAAHRDAFLRSVTYYSIYFPVVELLESVAIALILWAGGIASLHGALTLGSLVAFIQYSERFFRPIRDLSERYNILQGAMASSERIFELLDTKPRIVPPAPEREAALLAPSADPASPAIEFRDVRFGYVAGEEVLQGLSFTVGRGESVALVGHTGAGKSTVASLLLRFHDVHGGTVLVEGRDVREWDPGALRRRAALVPQEVFLWSGGLRLNVELRGGRPAEAVDRALRVTGLQGLARRFQEEDAPIPAGPPSPAGGAGVGERGARVSAGERQLIAIARALAADPPILILDEATANVDTETEQRIRTALRELLRGRTSLIIAHRLSTIRHADRILVLHRGRLAEEGTHDALLRRGGIYARYYELEYRGQEVTA